MKDVIEKMVREEIHALLAEHKTSIEQIVSSVLMPELKAAVRESVSDALKALTEKPSYSADFLLRTSDRRSPTSDLRPPTSDLRLPTSDLRPPTSDLRPPTPDIEPPKGRYIYCIADSTEAGSLGKIGIEENAVYSIPYKDLCAVVHTCSARPYASEDPEIVKGWVMAHQKVVDAAWEKFGTVIPIGFDTIIQGDEGDDPEKMMKKWIESDYDSLKAKMEKIRGRAEYGVQVIWDKNMAARKATLESDEINELTKKIQSKPRGVAYMYRQKLDSLVRKEIETLAERYFREFYEKIVPHADEIRVEKTRKMEDEDKQMLLNLSCLLPKDGSQALGDELEKIDALDGFSVRYTGPWPPYSFV